MKNTFETSPIRLVKRRRRRIKPYILDRIIVAAIIIVLSALIALVVSLVVDGAEMTAEASTIEIEETQATETSINDIPEMPTEPAPFFVLTSEQRTLIEQVVSAESRGEPYDGQVAVAQCILNACLKDDITPERAIKKYKYTGARVEPTESVKEAVAAVFDRGEGVTEEPILYFYAPARVTSDWHESQDFVVEIKNHRFFKETA